MVFVWFLMARLLLADEAGTEVRAVRLGYGKGESHATSHGGAWHGSQPVVRSYNGSVIWHDMLSCDYFTDTFLPLRM